MAEGIVGNSFEDLEPGAIKALHEEEPGKPPVYAVGPLIHNDGSNNAKEMECLTWLDEQSCNSVLYISFGSGGTLSHEQLIELPMGLEMSNQRFLWTLFVEQRMNTLMLTEDLKVALRLKFSDQNGIVERKEITKIVKRLMESEEAKVLRGRMRDLKDAGDKAVGEDGLPQNH
ncbi:Hydroquinone glucosyltransferase [Capsicum annuum]|uniref:Hydroquinone glucosyltransferase n=1 Tax=Capsicum annuum TaxID=4072 RepID=A0A2G2ZI65_CAPAN|nr:Hydroquinone glucosyltransferase [Capsicum annuum]KAF3654640.1 Hydroquinone glucosyltransferase [Capsicum annuum]PHT81611.1 Hydroquinone glucosyltransferase [Capsicum annuum]